MVVESTDVSNATLMSLVTMVSRRAFLKFEDVTVNKCACDIAPAILFELWMLPWWHRGWTGYRLLLKNPYPRQCLCIVMHILYVKPCHVAVSSQNTRVQDLFSHTHRNAGRVAGWVVWVKTSCSNKMELQFEVSGHSVWKRDSAVGGVQTHYGPPWWHWQWFYPLPNRQFFILLMCFPEFSNDSLDYRRVQLSHLLSCCLCCCFWLMMSGGRIV